MFSTRVKNLYLYTGYSRHVKESHHRYMHLYSAHPSEFMKGASFQAFHTWKELHFAIHGLPSSFPIPPVLPNVRAPALRAVRSRKFHTTASINPNSQKSFNFHSNSFQSSSGKSENSEKERREQHDVDLPKGTPKASGSTSWRSSLCMKRMRGMKKFGPLAMEDGDGDGGWGNSEETEKNWKKLCKRSSISFFFWNCDTLSSKPQKLWTLLKKEFQVSSHSVKPITFSLPRPNRLKVPEIPIFSRRIILNAKKECLPEFWELLINLKTVWTKISQFLPIDNTIITTPAIQFQLQQASFFHLLYYPIVAIFKSSTSLHLVTSISRVSLSLLPVSTIAARFHSSNGLKWLGLSLLLLPLLLSSTVFLSSLERTPISGRVRMMLLSEGEERDLVHSVLEPGVGRTSDWVSILKGVLGEEPDRGRIKTLMGGRVLDSKDWRSGWAQRVLTNLEGGVVLLTENHDGKGGEGLPTLHYPLTSRLGGEVGDPKKFYDVLVVERSERNAFSFGFGPSDWVSQGVSGGVIVVFTGFIDHILGQYHSPTPLVAEVPKSSSFFGSIFFHSPLSLPSSPPPSYADLISLQADSSLAVLLSHELSHLLLSHTLESYANNGQTFLHVRRMFVDMIRSATWPILSLLGPFFNDAISKTAQVAVVNGFNKGYEELGESCKSHMLEYEADLASLRLLKAAGYDPYVAIQFWEDRAKEHSEGVDSQEEAQKSMAIQQLWYEHRHGRGTRESEGIQRWRGGTHPVDQERVHRIRKELERWEKEMLNS